MTDVTGRVTANILGTVNEWAQNGIGLISGNPNVSDDARDYMNNEIGREFAVRNPGLSAEEYHIAMAELAERGNLVLDPNFTYPDFPGGVGAVKSFTSYIDMMVNLALDPTVTDLFDRAPGDDPNATPAHCFLSRTRVRMWPLDPSIKPRADGSYDEGLVLSKVWEKPIEDIRVGDVVVSYDDQGRIKPGTVTRTMTNTVTHILDFWGAGVTPGHAYYCADGKFADQHVPLMDILRTDGAIMRADGTMVRAATNCEVGSMGDRLIQASATKKLPDGSWAPMTTGQVRFGTRIVLPDGKHMSFLEMAQEEGWKVTDTGYMVGMMKGEDGTVEERVFHFPYCFGEELPKPEDYILARSDVTLDAIYAAGEWEQIGTQMPAPEHMIGLNIDHRSRLFQPSKPSPNIPPAFADHPDAPMRRRQKATDA